MGLKGFQKLTPERRRELASMGGKAAHAQGTAHQWDSQEAKIAGSKGGKVSQGGKGRNWRPDEVSDAPKTGE